MNESLIVLTLAAVIAAATPLVLAGVGELIAERAGIINLGVEGMMLVGAVTCFLVTMSSTNMLLGMLVGAASAAVLAGVHAVATIAFRANQIVSGLALVILGTGVAQFLGKAVEGVPLQHRLTGVALPVLSEIPVLGPILFQQNILVYVSWAMVLMVAFYFNRTKFGLGHRAVGENPLAADTVGIRVGLIQYVSTIVGGAFAGLAGAYIVLAEVSSWSQAGTTGGLGWIAIALVVFSSWRPWRLLLGAVLFGVVLRGGFVFQAVGDVNVPGSFLSMLPYVLTIIVMVAMSLGRGRSRAGAPASLGVAYVRGER